MSVERDDWAPPRGFRPAIEFLLLERGEERAVVQGGERAVTLDGVDLSDYVQSVSIETEQEVIDVTRFGGEPEFMPGLKKTTVRIMLLGTPMLPMSPTAQRLRVGDQLDAFVVLQGVIRNGVVGDLITTEITALVTGVPVTITATRRVRVRA